MRYYDLDSDGWPFASYKRPQPAKDLRYLPERQSEYERWDDETGTWVEDEAAKAADVERECLDRIDAKASEVRARFITAGVGQSAVYLSKYEEAVNYKAASSPTDSDYPYLDKEASRRGMTVGDLADEVVATRNTWTDPASATIEAERVGGKEGVRAVSTVTDKEAARDQAIAALDAIQPQ